MAHSDTLDLKVNGAAETVGVETVAQLLDIMCLDASRKGIAVAVNGVVVPRARWPHHVLASGDSVEVIQARQGG